VFEHAGACREFDLGAALQRFVEPLSELEAAVAQDQHAVVAQQRGIALHGRLEAAHQRRHQVIGVFQWRHARRQTEVRQQIERRGGEQLRVPGVHCAHLDAAAAGEHAFVQADQVGAALLRFGLADAELHQQRCRVG
jgi:hypothetical protein